ncbi:MAG: undecaprenyl/decaprenyl-phosphate alpha-N-acetylglucosaminyl 1-phosphate transferase [Alphaproteobacteria bacterium]|nr:undecaprenyl/decaprenyl-phosphate alpha-N-acetylglucosaminyl 1-phosphate transferase [Alphaproteobacteria bacterium]
MNIPYPFMLTLVLSFLISIVIVAISRRFDRPDYHLSEKRAAHKIATPRLGGLAIIIAIFAGVFMYAISVKWDLLLALLPIFIAGICEDVHRPIHPYLRLCLGVISAGIFIFFTGIWLTEINFPYVNALLSYPVIGIAFTILAIVTLINSINMIDGINGLASGKTLIMSAAIIALSQQVSEPNIAVLNALIFSAVLGFFILNYPTGRIFMGDAGAYSLGFLIAISLIVLKSRHPEVSGWAILLIVFWPAMDMLHSIFRRIYKKSDATRPDMMHFHHVLMRRIEIASKGRITRSWSNPYATAIILPMSALPVLIGFSYYNSSDICALAVAFFLILYSAIYIRLLR